MSARPPPAAASPMPFFVRTICPFNPPASASVESLLAFGKGELGLIHHVEPSGWAECRLLKCGSVGWMPLNFCNVFDPRPMRPLLKAVIKLTEDLRLDPDVPVVSRAEAEDIDAILYGVSNIMILGYRLDANYPHIGAWKVLSPIIMCIHDRLLVLQKHVGTTREFNPSEGKKDTINRIGLASVALEIVTKVDSYLLAIQKLHKSHACRSLTNVESPSTVENGSKTSPTTAAVDVSNKEPDSPSAKGPDKHKQVAFLDPPSSHGFTERESSPQAQKREDNCHDLRDSDFETQLEQHAVDRTDDIPPQPPGHQTFIPDQSFIERTRMTRCSLPALIEHLTNCEPQSIRQQFVTAFFITCELFCTPEELLKALTKRFMDAQNEQAQQRKRIQFRVCYALRVWLQSFWVPNTDQHILLSLDSFLRREVHKVLPASSAFLLQIAKSIDNVQHDHSSNSPSTPSIKGNRACRHGSNMTMDIANSLFACRGDKMSVVPIRHDYLAAQITYKQMQVFCAIQSRELLAGRWMAHDSTDAPSVLAMCWLTNGISNWVKESVLTEAEPKSRSHIIERWILIAQHLFQLNNFDGLVAVTSGLDDTSVLRLGLSWDAVSVQAKESFRSLRRIVDPSENRKTLRALFSSSPAPRLPFLGSYLSQLVFTNGYHKDKNAKEGGASSGSDEKLINWEKYARIASIIKELIDSQQPFDITPDVELQMWIGKRTSEFWCTDQNCLQEIYYERSRFLEPGMSRDKGQSPLRFLFHSKT